MHLNIQDLMAILGPIGVIFGFMWYHFNRRFEKIEDKIDNVDKHLGEKIDAVEKRLDKKIDSVDKRLGEKIDAVRDRVSRIEGQLTPAKVVSFHEDSKSKKKAKGE